MIQAQSADFGAYRQRLAGGVPQTKPDEPARQATGQVEARVDDKKPRRRHGTGQADAVAGAACRRSGARSESLEGTRRQGHLDARGRAGEERRRAEEAVGCYRRGRFEVRSSTAADRRPLQPPLPRRRLPRPRRPSCPPSTGTSAGAAAPAPAPVALQCLHRLRHRSGSDAPAP